MQLDKTHIAIRERGFLEICDLSLRAAWLYGRPLVLWMLLGLLPFALLNWYLIGWMVDKEFDLEGAGGARYLYVMALLVLIQAPLASSLATLYLGDAIFLEQPTAGKILAQAWRLSPQLFVCHMLLRGVLPAWLCAWSLSPYDMAAGDLFLPFLVTIVLLVRAVRPFVNEIVLLEKNPLRSARGQAQTVWRRSQKLHGPSSGELLGRGLASVFFAVLLTTSLALTLWFIQGMAGFGWEWGTLYYYVLVPAAMWMVAAYFTVVRFLSYLDLRIRLEGWAVDLQLRAEAARLAKQLV